MVSSMIVSTPVPSPCAYAQGLLPGTFLLLKAKPDGTYENMAVSKMPEMTQFLQEFENYGTNDAAINVTYRAYGDAEKAKTIQIPLLPDTESLEPYQVTMHSSPTPAFLMPAEYSSWFSSCFGYDVILVYLGDNRRPVMFEDMQPLEPDPLTLFLKKHVPIVGEYVDRLVGPRQTEQWRLTFADCAPYLITSKTSLDDLSSRMPAGEEVDMRKFRPNIVIEGANEPWQEDYWGKVTINQKTDIIMAHNCVRCTSVNLDYDTGKPATGAAGEVLKRMQKDRRIDIGAKWSPVFGRYSFWDPKRPSQTIKVGDKVNVTKVNEGLTVWSKFARTDPNWGFHLHGAKADMRQVGQACLKQTSTWTSIDGQRTRCVTVCHGNVHGEVCRIPVTKYRFCCTLSFFRIINTFIAFVVTILCQIYLNRTTSLLPSVYTTVTVLTFSLFEPKLCLLRLYTSLILSPSTVAHLRDQDGTTTTISRGHQCLTRS
jgi:uncharacterized protein YcbX